LLVVVDSRFNCHLRTLGDWLPLLSDIKGEVFATGEAFVIDRRIAHNEERR